MRESPVHHALTTMRAALFLGVVLLLLPTPSARADPPWKPEEPEAHKALVEAARAYFDLETEPWRGRKGFLEELDREADAGRFWLKDMDALRWLVYQGRSFEPPMTDRKWQRKNGIGEYKRLGGTLHWIKSEHLTIAFSIPEKYPKPKDFSARFPRHDPYPLLLSMHEKQDHTGQKYPGQVLLERRYPRAQWKDLYEDWLMLCPIAAAGNFLDAQGMIRAEAFQKPYAYFWKHYHVDFDRVVLDGTAQAFPAAAALPIFFAGIIFRNGTTGPWGLASDEMKRDVRNFASVPVYVVDNPALARQLRQAGHGDVTTGAADAALLAWMQARRRVEPKKFAWVVQRQDQLLPYWVNLEGLDWEANVRCLEVEVADTEKEPNTIQIQALGVDALTLFLDDEIVDLDRPVRVVINGHVEYSGLVDASDEEGDYRGRHIDLVFDRDPTRIRLSMFFGWLKTARIVGLKVRPPSGPGSCGTDLAAPVPEAPPPKPPVAEPPAEDTVPPPATKSPKKSPRKERSSGGLIAASLFLLFLVVLLFLLGIRSRRDLAPGEESAAEPDGGPEK